ncbi:MAG: ribonuclease J [Candidatus Izemoplasmatales bacterium]|nr:ribonuclease J [Candidatus Izemoplasmatales bacterium]
MSQIKFFALGGLGENGKNLYCLEIEKRLVILDAGLKHPSGDLLGVDAIVPDITYLESRAKDIVGVFLSHAHDKNMGAMPLLLSQINVPVYATPFTIAVLKDLLLENKFDPDRFSLHPVKYNQRLDFPHFDVEFFPTTHSIPESAGIAIGTDDGVIVYATDFTFDQNVGMYYKTNFHQLSMIQERGVLALLAESSGASTIGHSTTDFKLTRLIRQTFEKAPHRIIVAMYSTELSNIQKVINEGLRIGKKISIIGRKAQRMVDIGEAQGYIQIPEDKLVNLKFIDETNKNELDDTIFLVTGERHEPFFMLQRMAKGYDRLIKLIETDTVFLLCPPIIGTEKIAAKTYDTIYRLGVKPIKVDKKIISPFHAASEDLKMMYGLLSPKYIIPVSGDYRYQLAHELIAKEYGYDDEHVISIDNGEVITFTDGFLELRHDTVMNGNVMVDGNFESDVNDVVLKERELLSQDGFLMIIANIDARERIMLNKPEIVSRGFMYMKDNEEVIKQIETIYEAVTQKQFDQRYIDWKVYKESIRYETQKYLFKETKRKPIVIPVIIDTQSDKVCKVL